MKRRNFIFALAVTAALSRSWRLATAGVSPQPSLSDIRNHWKALLAHDAQITTSATPIQRTPDEWRKLLTPQQYAVLREEDTERPFTSALNHEWRAGVFVCVACALPLFTSEMKFDSGTGWPSFFTTIPGAFATKVDLQLIYPRTEYHCIKCGGHHGHVFDDGPPPTGQRWCNNGVALRFLPIE
jgi:peptide-methionine (R)-S-oxide reductase